MLFSFSKYSLFCLPVTVVSLFIILLLRIYLITITDIPLHFDEAQYWSWSQDLKWGYFSKPPLLAWIIGLSNYLCGSTENCIRLPVPILYFTATIFVFLSTRILTNNEVASSFSAITFNLMPGITFSSFITTTDVPLIFFSSAFAYVLLIIYKKENPSYSYFFLLSTIFLLGFLSKYAMAYLLISSLISIIYFKEVRKKILKFRGFIFILTFFILILPHFYWNFKNGFVTFNHTVQNANVGTVNLNLKEPFFFILAQFFLFGLYPFYLILQNIPKYKKLNNESKILLIYFLTPIIIISILSIFSRANANWAAVGFPFGFIFLAVMLNRKNLILKKYYLFLSQLLLSSMIIVVILLGKNNSLLDPFSKQKHAKELALFVSKELNNIKDVAFMADDREDFALMLYYVRDFKGKRAKWNGDIKIDDHYELTTDTNNLVGYNILFLTRTAPTEEMIKRSTSHKLVKELSFFNRKKIKKYNLYLLMNWKKI